MSHNSSVSPLSIHIDFYYYCLPIQYHLKQKKQNKGTPEEISEFIDVSTGAGGHHYKLFMKIYRGCIAGQEKAPRYGQPASHLEEEGEATATTPQPSNRVEIVILAHSHTSQPASQPKNPPTQRLLSYATSAAAARKFYRPLSMQPQAECGCSLCKLIDLKSFHPIRDERTQLQRGTGRITWFDTRLHRHRRRSHVYCCAPH